MNVFTARVVGTRHREHPGQLDTVSHLSVRRVRRNHADRNAIGIYLDGRLYGYLQRGLSDLLAPEIDTRRARLVASSARPKDHEINLFVLRAERDRGVVRRVRSSDQHRYYFTDPVNQLCTCPAGLLASYGSKPCKHIRRFLTNEVTPTVAIVAA